MPTPHVSLQEVLSALGGPLEERALWALLRQGASTLAREIRATEVPRLLISPESMLLYHGGAVQFLQGLPDNSSFMAPEQFAGKPVIGRDAVEKSYVYSLGMTMFAAMQFGLENDQTPSVSEPLQQFLLSMIEDSLELRSSLQHVTKFSKQHTEEAEQELIDGLVTYILGNELSSDDCGDADLDDANLETQIQEAQNMRSAGSVEQLYSPSYGSRTSSSQSITSKGSQGVRRISSFHSVGGSHENLPPSSPLSSSSLPPVYFTRSQDRLNKHPRSHHWSSNERLGLHLQPQDLAILTSKGRRQLPPDPCMQHSHLYTPVRSRKHVSISKHLPKDVHRSASFNEPSPSPQGTGEVGMQVNRIRSDEPSHRAEFLPPELPPPPPPPPPLPPPPSQSDVEDFQLPVMEVHAMESEMPLEASWELPDLTTPEEDSHHKEDLPSDNVPSVPPPPVPPSDEEEEEEEEHPSSKAAPEHTPAMDLSIASITLDDMPSLPPPPPPSFLPSDKEEEEEGEQTHSEGAAPAEVNPSLKKIESILQSVGTKRQDSDSEQIQEEDQLDAASDGAVSPPETMEEERQGSEPHTPPPSHPPPPLPTTEPPMFTPFPREEKAAPEHTHNASFDYSEMGDTVKEMESKREDEFEFPVADSTSHTPPLLSYEPPELAPEDFTPPPSPPPLPPSSPPRCDSPIFEEMATIVEAHTQESVPDTAPAERDVPTQRAPDETFQHKEKEVSHPDVSGDQSVGGSDSQQQISELYAKVIKPPTTLEEEPPSLDVSDQGVTLRKKEEEKEGQRPISELYAKVYKPPKTGTNSQKKEPLSLDSDQGVTLRKKEEEEKEGQRPISELYAKVNKRPSETVKLRKKEEERPVSELYATVKKAGTSSGEKEEGELVWKAPSADDVMSLHVAEVYDPKRSSMPPDSVPVTQFVSSSTSSPVAPPLPPRSPGSMFDVTFDEDWQKLHENETSLHKLQKVFGPEFAHLSGGQKKPPPAQCESVTGRRVVRVVLLNGCSVDFTVEHDSCCQDLFLQVVSYQSLWERHVFGLAVVKNRQEIFLDLDRKLTKYAPTNWTTAPSTSPPSFIVFFRVKYYIENVTQLRLPQTRHQYYLQLRKDLLEGKMYCHEETALKVAAFALQAEKGDYDALEKRHSYFRPEDYLPEKVIAKLGPQYIHDLLPNMHAEQFGLTREAAELEFLKEAQKLPEYGNVFYQVAKDKRGAEGQVWLGFCVRGIVVYNVHKDVKTPIHHCPWKKTKNISFANRKFIVEMQDSKPLVFYTASYKRARYLLHLSRSYHRFQLYARGLSSQADETIPGPQLESPTKGSFTPSTPSGEVHEIRLLKEPGKGLGIRIADQMSEGGSQVVVAEVLKGGAADMDGKLKKGDVLLSLDGQSLEGMGHREAAELLAKAPSVVTFSVWREEAIKGPPSIVTEVVVEHPPLSSSSPPYATTTLERDSTRLQSPPPHPPPPVLSPTPLEMLTVRIKKGANRSFGLAISGSSQDAAVGVIVHKVSEGGVAKGMVAVGDRIVAVNGTTTEGKSYHEVLSLLQTSGEELQLELLRRAKPTSTSHIPDLPHGEGFIVEVVKHCGTLGLRIAGGADKPIGAGFIRIKQLGAKSPAAECGRLREGDILLQVNAESLVGVTHRQAAEILLQSGERVCLHVYRPSTDNWLEMMGGGMSGLPSVSEESELPLSVSMEPSEALEEESGAPWAETVMDQSGDVLGGLPDDVTPPVVPASPPHPHCSLEENTDPLSSMSEPELLPAEKGGDTRGLPVAQSEPCILEALAHHSPEEETVILRKGFRGLGFTIDKSRSGQKDQGLYVLSVDSDPAKSDGHLQPGDEVIQVNSVTLVNRPHAEGMALLRQAKGTVTLTVRRSRTQSLHSDNETAGSREGDSLPQEEKTLVNTEDAQLKPNIFHIPPPPDSPPPSPPASPPPSPPPSLPPSPTSEVPPDMELEIVEPEGGRGMPPTPPPLEGGRATPPLPASGPPLEGGRATPPLPASGPPLEGGRATPPPPASGPPLEGGRATPPLPASGPPLEGGRATPPLPASGPPLEGGRGMPPTPPPLEGGRGTPPPPASGPPLEGGRGTPPPPASGPPLENIPSEPIGDTLVSSLLAPSRTPPLDNLSNTVPEVESSPSAADLEEDTDREKHGTQHGPACPTSEPPLDLSDWEVRGEDEEEHEPAPPSSTSHHPTLAAAEGDQLHSTKGEKSSFSTSNP